MATYGQRKATSDDELLEEHLSRVRWGLNKLLLQLRNMRLTGVDSVICIALLPIFGFVLLNGTHHLPGFTLVGLFLIGLLITATTFGLNNIADAKIDRRDPFKQKNRINPISSGQLSRIEALVPLLGLSILAIWIASELSVLLPTLAALFVGALYSVPPVRLKERPGLDILAHIIMPLLIVIVGMSAAQANYPLTAVAGSMLLILLSAKSETTNLIRDHESDLSHGISTTAVRLGIPTMLRLRLSLLSLSIIIILAAAWFDVLSIIPALMLAAVITFEAIASLRPGYYAPKQRALLVAGYIISVLAIVLFGI
ncbi:MAG: UbiA family prenyltransferase [Chloroflexota bacterium]|nr:UbiA family prenyltransferase [Chloroflexota bacterium]